MSTHTTTPRQQQLAQALRENLLRRKAQQRSRADLLQPQGNSLMPDARPLTPEATPERPLNDRHE